MDTGVGNRRWLWYFLVLGVLAVGAAGGLIVYNLRQQLTPDDLAAARARWKEKGPKDYRLVYVKRGSITGRFEVEVRGGRTVRALADGQPLETRLLPYYGMPALFEDLQAFLDRKNEPGGRRRFLRAFFDETDGHILQFVLSDPSLEVAVLELSPLPPSEGSPPSTQPPAGR